MRRTTLLPTRRMLVLLTTLLLPPGGMVVGSDECVDYGNYLHLRSRLAVPGIGENVAVSGSYAYLADGSGLQVIDLTSPDAPVTVGALETPGNAFDVAISGNFAFVADSSGLLVVDITNPSAPVAVSSVDESGAVTIQGNYAYLAGAGLLQVIDITDPLRPSLKGSVQVREAEGASDVDVSGGYAYVTATRSSSYLQVIDIMDPADPAVVGLLDTAGTGYSVTVSDGFAYVGANVDFRDGFRIVDVTDPTVPFLSGEFDFNVHGLRVEDIAIVGPNAYAACVHGICAIDVRDPARPRLIGISDFSNIDGDFGLALTGDHLLVASSIGLLVYQGPGGGLAPLAGSLDMNLAVDAAASGDYAYVTSGTHGFFVADLADLGAPHTIASIETPDAARDVALMNEHAYVADAAGLRAINVTDPLAPFIEGSLDTPGNGPNDIAVSENYAYLAANNEGLQVIDVEDPAAPFLAGSLQLPGRARELAVSDDLVYVSARGLYDGLHIVDITSPTSPMLVGSLATSADAGGVAVLDRNAYLTLAHGLHVIDVSDPTAPEIAGVAIVPFSRDVAVHGKHAYVTRKGGVQVINIEDPTSPGLVGGFEVPGDPRGVTVSGGRVLVATAADPVRGESGGLRIASLQCDSVPLDVAIDIKPGTDTNAVNPRSRGVIPVAVLGTDSFDVARIDPSTLGFGPSGTNTTRRNGLVLDVNYDGIMDLLLHFRTQDTGIACGDDSAKLTGMTTDGESFVGTDSIRTVGCTNGRRRFRAAFEPE